MFTSQQVKDFWIFMQNEFGSAVEQKNDALVMQIVAQIIDILHIQDKNQFMKDFVTTIGETIYIPFKIGVEEDHWSLWGQVRVCVHEHQHIVQGNRVGWIEFDSKYLTSSSYRASYEAEAFGSDMEMEFWRTGMILDINQRASILKNYGCTNEDIEMVKQILTMRSEVVKQGVAETKAAQVAINWLETNIASGWF